MLRERPKRRLCERNGKAFKCIRRPGHPGDCVMSPPPECRDGNAVIVGGLFHSMRMRRLDPKNARRYSEAYDPNEDDPA